MKISFESDKVIPAVTQAIASMMDKAKVCIDDIHHDLEKGIVTISLQRKELVGFRKTWWGVMQPVYGQTMIRSYLIIHSVEEMKIQTESTLTIDYHLCFTVLFGLDIRERELYLGSAEEIVGKPLCEVFIKVKKIGIEFWDDEK